MVLNNSESELNIMLNNRRSSQRHRVLRRGSIVFHKGHSAIDCVLLDLSAGGAKLRVGQWLGMPNRFELRIENGLSREAEVRFRELDIACVEFVDLIAA